MSDQQRAFLHQHSSHIREGSKAAANYVPGATLFVIIKGASGQRHIAWVDEDDDVSDRRDEIESRHTPDEKTRLMVTEVIEETPPFVACFAFCFTLNVMLACFFLVILIIYLLYRFGFTTEPYDEELCNYMRSWNQKILWLFVAVCGLGIVDLVGLCRVLAKAPSQDGYDTIPGTGISPQEQESIQETAQTIMPCWIKTRSVLKYLIDVIFFVWMIQAFWMTNVKVPNMDECPNMYTFTHIYSSIVSVLAVLGLLSAGLFWCLVRLYGKRSNTNHAPVQMTV